MTVTRSLDTRREHGPPACRVRRTLPPGVGALPGKPPRGEAPRIDGSVRSKFIFGIACWKRRATRWSQKRVEGNPLDGLEASPRPRWPVSALASARFVTISLAHALTGYTVNAIETKIKRGVWIEGREWRRAPDGRVLIDMRGYERWVESQNCAAPKKRAISSNSTS